MPLNPVDNPLQKDTREKIRYLLRFAEAFHTYGMNAFRLEAALVSMAKTIGLKANFYCTPTMITAAFDVPEGQISRHARVGPGDINLGKLCTIDSLADQLVHGEAPWNDIDQKLTATIESEDSYPRWLRLVCFAVAASCFSIVLSNRWQDALAALGIGLLSGVVDWYGDVIPKTKQLKEVLVAFVVSVFAIIIDRATTLNVQVPVVVLAGLLQYLPGITLTVAMSELAMNHLASGTDRFMSSIMTLIKLAFGAGLAFQIAHTNYGQAAVLRSNLGPWMPWIAMTVSSLCLGVLFRARVRELGLVFVAAVIGVVGTRIGQAMLGVEMGAFLGGLITGASSNLLALLLKRPVTLFLLPGITLSVPGSLGLKSITSFFGQNVNAGMTNATIAVSVAISIVAGLFIGNLLINPRRNL